MAMTGKRLAKG